MPGPLKSTRICLKCGQQFRPNNWKQVYCKPCAEVHKGEYQRRYFSNYYGAHSEAILTRMRQRRAEIRMGRPPLRKGHPRVNPKDPRDCFRCGRDFMPTAPNQKFCPDCGPKAFRELANVRSKQYGLNHKEQIRQRNAEYKLKHKNDETFQSRRRLWSKTYNAQVRRMVLGYYSGGKPACKCCGEAEIDFLTIDHVGNNGGQERRALGYKNVGGVMFYKKLILRGYPQGYQTLCFDCNGSKGKHGECIHRRKVMHPDSRTKALDEWMEHLPRAKPQALDEPIPLPVHPDSSATVRLARDYSSQSLLSVINEPRMKLLLHVLG